MHKTTVITGASQGIGYELAKLFAKDKYNLVIIARNHEKLNDIAKELISKYGIQIMVIAQDLAEPNAAQIIYQKLQKNNISVDVLINNAGFATYGEFIENSIKEETDEIQVNVTTLTILTKLFVKDMVNRGSGKVLNVASTAAFLPGPYMAVYYATKAYVLSFSEGLHEELKGSGVTVTVLCPGPTSTGFAVRAKLENSNFFIHNVMKVSDVASIAYSDLLKGKKLIIPGIRNKASIWGIKFIPRSLLVKYIKRMQSTI